MPPDRMMIEWYFYTHFFRKGEKTKVKEVTVKVIEQFHDRDYDMKLRTKDTVLTVLEERAQNLIRLRFVKKVKAEVEKLA